MAAAALFTAGCQSLRNGPTPGTPARHGTLLLIGGGLDDDNRPARIVIATAATGDQETVATIDQASAMFFTGGDQQRITDRYHPHDQPSPEWLAMGRLLARGGVIAGTSAGDAKMGEEDEEDPAQLGPRLGPGMRFLPWAISDSHFFERDRIGRLVAALEATGRQRPQPPRAQRVRCPSSNPGRTANSPPGNCSGRRATRKARRFASSSTATRS